MAANASSSSEIRSRRFWRYLRAARVLRWRLRVTAESSSSGEDLRLRDDDDDDEGEGCREKVDVPGMEDVDVGDLFVIVGGGGLGVLDVEVEDCCSMGVVDLVTRGCS